MDGEEDPFLLADRASERATVIVAGTRKLPHDSATEVVIAQRHGRFVGPVAGEG
jgi:hypothetical protein